MQHKLDKTQYFYHVKYCNLKFYKDTLKVEERCFFLNCSKGWLFP